MTGVTDIPLAAAVPVAVPLANAAPGGPQGPAGPTGPQGPPGAVEVFEQPGTPTEPVPSGSLWIDTDATPPAGPAAPDGTPLGAVVRVTAAQMIALPSTPILLVAGVAGKIIVPISLGVFDQPGSSGWVGIDNWQLCHRSQVGNYFVTGSLTGFPGAQFLLCSLSGLSYTPLIGEDLVLANNGSSLTGGNGFFDFAISYALLGTT